MALTNDKLVIVGAAGMIGSNMVQTALMMGLTSDICLYDVFSPEGVAEEMRQSGFGDVKITATTDAKEAFTNAKYIISSGGAPRKEGMTREDLLKGNCEIAEGLGKDIKTYCPDVKHVVIIFNPADLTGLVTLLYSGLKPCQVTTLAALDTTRLQSALAKKFGVMQSEITGCATYGGHGEQMAVFGSHVEIAGRKLTDIVGTPEFPSEEWEQMKVDVTKGPRRNGWREVPLPRGHLRLQRQVQPHHDGDGHYPRRERCLLQGASGYAQRERQARCQLRAPVQDARRTGSTQHRSSHQRVEQDQSQPLITAINLK